MSLGPTVVILDTLGYHNGCKNDGALEVVTQGPPPKGRRTSRIERPRGTPLTAVSKIAKHDGPAAQSPSARTVLVN